MSRFKHRFLLILLLMVTGLSAPVWAEGEGTAGDYFSGMGRQIGRGLWNVVSSLAEIPCTINSEMEVKGGSGFLPGLGKGFAFFGRRLLVGVVEVGTFIMPAEPTLAPVCSKAQV